MKLSSFRWLLHEQLQNLFPAMLYARLLWKTQCLPRTFKAQLNKALEKGPRGRMAWSVGCAKRRHEEAFTISKTLGGSEKTRLKKKKDKRQKQVAVRSRGLVSSSQHLQKGLNPERETLGRR